MAGFSIAVMGIMLIMIVGASALGLICFIVSLILLLIKTKKEKLNKKKFGVKRVIGFILLMVGIGCQIPLGITFLLGAYAGHKMEEDVKRDWDSIENKVAVDENWADGFIYNEDHLIPINIFMNSDRYYEINNNGGNLNQIGALVFGEDYNYYNFYEIVNNSGYEIYYVWQTSFTDGEHSSRTFVKEEDYDAVLDYYEQATGYSASVLWSSAPAETSYAYSWYSLNLDMDSRVDWVTSFSHEVLDDVTTKKTGVFPQYNDLQNCDDYMEFTIESEDGVFTLGISLYTFGEEMYLFLNNYEVDEKIVNQYKPQLLELINEAKEEMLSQQ